MNEFEEKDFEQARSYANAVGENATRISDIFKKVDNDIKCLVAIWDSAAAREYKARYDVISKNYEAFYNDINAMKDHINKVTSVNEATDAAVNKDIESF